MHTKSAKLLLNTDELKIQKNCFFICLKNYIENKQFDPSQFYVVNNNSKINDYPIKHNININVHELDFIPHSSTKVLSFKGGCKFVNDKNGK